MPVQIRLQSYQLADLAAIARLGPEAVARVVDRLRSERPVRHVELHRIVTNALSGNDDAADQVLRPVLSLSSVIRQRDLEIDDVLSGLDEGISLADDPWPGDLVTSWRDVRPHLRELFESTAVQVVSKATDLAYDYANLFQGARIITDIRPVYDADATRIEAAVVSYTLRLHYDNRAGDQSISIALDESDVLLIREQCERALDKARLAKELVRSGVAVPTVISGADDDV